MNTNIIYLDSTFGIYKQLFTRYDPDPGIMWYSMIPAPRPCFNPDLLEELRKLQRVIEQTNRMEIERGNDCPVKYIVLASLVPGVFNLGGDLSLFIKYIKTRDIDGLRRYALSCIDVLFQNYMNFNLPMTTISLVQGDAMGGGLEAALSSNVVIAEKNALLGFPEIMFNLFPGMGAYSLLAGRLDPVRAEKMIFSGRIYKASELYEMGLIDVLAEDGEGEDAVYEYVRKHSRRRSAFQSLFKVRQRHIGITYEKLSEVVDLWIETATNLGPNDLRVMERLIKSQEKLPNGSMPIDGAIERPA